MKEKREREKDPLQCIKAMRKDTMKKPDSLIKKGTVTMLMSMAQGFYSIDQLQKGKNRKRQHSLFLEHPPIKRSR